MRNARRILALALPAYLVANVISAEEGGPNVASRLAALAALVEDGTPRIDRYVQGPRSWTHDWSRTPDGSYYSNKAPGPILYGLPLFAAIDARLHGDLPDRPARDRARLQHQTLLSFALSFALQVLPWAVLVGGIVVWLDARGASLAASAFAALALLFGNTASLYLNTWFGHGLAALCVLGAAYTLLLRRWRLCGLLLGSAVLSEYSCALVVPLLLGWVVAREPERSRVLLRLGLGALLPAALFAGYHAAAFGDPFAIAAAFQNPDFVAGDPSTAFSWPRPRVVLALLFGAERGLLVTQPWVFVVAAAAGLAWRRAAGDPELAAVAFLAVASLVAFLAMNAGFNGWHGGHAAGPRYLSPVLPLFALLAGFALDGAPRPLVLAAWLGLGVSLVFYALVTLYGRLIPFASLWPYLVDSLRRGGVA